LLGNIKPASLPDFNDGQALLTGQSNDYYKAEFIKRYGEETVLADPLGDSVILSLRLYADKGPTSAEWKFNKSGHAELLHLVGDMILHPYEIWLTPQKSESSGRIRLTKRYLSLWKTPDKQRIGGFAVFEVVGGCFQGITAFEPLKSNGKFDLAYLERQRQGVLLYGKGK
jgi:hypothetical protein